MKKQKMQNAKRKKEFKTRYSFYVEVIITILAQTIS